MGLVVLPVARNSVWGVALGLSRDAMLKVGRLVQCYGQGASLVDCQFPKEPTTFEIDAFYYELL